jgi:hypothetical protein
LGLREGRGEEDCRQGKGLGWEDHEGKCISGLPDRLVQASPPPAEIAQILANTRVSLGLLLQHPHSKA